MEMERNQSMVAKKLWNTLRIVLFILRKGIAKKSKLMSELNLLLKRGKLAAGKLRHHCTAATATSFVSPHDYEFSCSNSPAFPKFRSHNKNRNRYKYDDVLSVQKVLEILNNNENSTVASASPMITLPGFGKSPIGKQLRITDSPFPLKVDEGDDDCYVDIAAEEFIKRFYKELNLQQQKFVASFQSPSPY